VGSDLVVTDVAMRSAPAGSTRTFGTLTADLRALAIPAGVVLLAHCSMRRIGWVDGGASTVVAALRSVLGADGTLVVPTQTAANSDTSAHHLARVAGMTAEQIASYRAGMPPFDAATTPSTGMGLLAETVRTTPGAVRSGHPQTSFAALGPRAHRLMDGHAPDCHLGEVSPLARLYAAGARILLAGVGYDACTAFHLAEYRYTPDPPRRSYRCVISRAGAPCWWEYEDVVLDDAELPRIGADFDLTGAVTRGHLGGAQCRLLPLRAAVDFAVRWLANHRAVRTP
jgi:aminoglycoside 3-N-acetyltransferase